MRLSRIHQEQPLVSGRVVTLDRDGSHYVSRVLRLKAGDRLNLFNTEYGEFAATITAVDRHAVTVQLGEAVPGTADPTFRIRLGLGLSRGERFDYAIQKSTELGVSEITPLVTEYCEVRLKGERADNRLAHWRKVAVSASEQCGRSTVPVINEPEALPAFLDCHGGGILLDASGDALLQRHEPAQPLNLLIGPEGGFSDTEVALARSRGYQVLRLGPRILRTETAPVVALSLLQFLFGDLAG